MARDVAYTFLQGGQRSDSAIAILQEVEAEVEFADDTGKNGGGEDIHKTDQVASGVTVEADLKTAAERKNVVNFALLGLLHALHDVKGMRNVLRDLQAVVAHLRGGNDAFTKMLISEDRRHGLVGAGDDKVFFLSNMEREFISQQAMASTSSPYGEGSSSQDVFQGECESPDLLSSMVRSMAPTHRPVSF